MPAIRFVRYYVDCLLICYCRYNYFADPVPVERIYLRNVDCYVTDVTLLQP